MKGAADLLESERGFFCVVIVVVCVVFVLLGKMTVDQWIDVMKWVAVTLVASKTVTGALETMASKSTGVMPPGAAS